MNEIFSCVYGRDGDRSGGFLNFAHAGKRSKFNRRRKIRSCTSPTDRSSGRWNGFDNSTGDRIGAIHRQLIRTDDAFNIDRW